MRDEIISAARALALIVASVIIGGLPFIGHHQTFVGEPPAVAATAP